MNKEELKQLANNLYFDMDDKEYETLEKEFNVILKEMDKIDKFEGIENVEPLIHPFKIERHLRNDKVKNIITTSEFLSNVKEKIGDEVKVPKVVGE